MREALTAEVADKHDKVVVLRHECQQLEERCRQADKQTHFKDDIIKEMRKELKQYRSKVIIMMMDAFSLFIALVLVIYPRTITKVVNKSNNQPVCYTKRTNNFFHRKL